jgi:hypothetical protein
MSGRNNPQGGQRKLANFIEPAHRGLPLLVPRYADAGHAQVGVPGEASARPSGPELNIEILPLSLVAASGHSAGAATTPLPGPR